MIKIVYCPEGDAFSEFVVEEYIENLVKRFKKNNFFEGQEKVFKFSTEMPIAYLTYHVLNKNIPIDLISFWDEEQNIPIDMIHGLETDPKLNWNIGKFVDIVEKIVNIGYANLKALQKERKLNGTN